MGFMRGRRGPWIWLVIGLFTAALLGGVAFYKPFDSATSLAAPLANSPESENQPVKLPGKRTTFLIMGVDKRPEDFGRADSMIVVSYDPPSNQLAILSLPRDTWVQIPGHGFDKVNHSYAYGGERLAVQVVERLLGIPINHFITISFQGFQEIIDEVGGVEVNAEKRMYYHDPFDTGMGPNGLVIDIQPGLQHMDGLTALKYSRYRMDDEGDFGRMRRQQQVIRALVKSAARPAILARIPQLIPALSHAIISDLSVGEMVRLAAGSRDALATPLRTGTLGGTDRVIGGVYYIIPDLVAERTSAYQVLVGSAPPEQFIQRAREDQARYSRTLTEELGQTGSAEPAAPGHGTPQSGTVTPGSQPPVTGSAAGQPSEGQSGTASDGQAAEPGITTPGATDPAGTPGAGTDPGSAAGGSDSGSDSGSGTGDGAIPGVRVPPITVALIDASGKQLGAEYATRLRAAGFRIARMGRTTEPIPLTTALDHAGQEGTLERLQAIMPNLLLIPRPDKNAGEAIEIILGADLP